MDILMLLALQGHSFITDTQLFFTILSAIVQGELVPGRFDGR